VEQQLLLIFYYRFAIKANSIILKNRLFLLFLFIYPLFTEAQNVRHLTVEEGLPQSFVSGMTEDEDGFIWISTHNGLARFDGHSYKIFRNKPQDLTTIASNYIITMFRGANDDLWLMYSGGEIDLFNVRTHQCTHVITKNTLDKYNLNIPRRGWAISHNKHLWYITKSGQVLRVNTSLVNVKTNKEIIHEYNLPGDAPLSIMEDHEKNIWILGRKSLQQFDSKLNRFITYKMPFATVYDPNFDLGEEIPMIIQRRNNELMWIEKNHLIFFSKTKRSFYKIKLPEDVSVNGKLLAMGPDGNVYFQVNNTIYNYSDAAGISKKAEIDIDTRRNIQALLVDNSGMIWIGANTDGIYQIDANTNFNAFTYREDFAADIFKDKLGIDAYTFFNVDPKDYGLMSLAYYLRSVYEPQRKITWVALNRTVCYFNENKKIIKLPRLPNIRSNTLNPIQGITVAKNKSIIVIDHYNNIYKLYDGPTWSILYSEEEVKNLLGPKFIPSALHTDGQNLWITTEDKGLLFLPLDKKRLKDTKNLPNHKLSAGNLYGLAADKNDSNVFWLASNNGLIRFNKKTYESRLFSVEEGFPDNIIYSIAIDTAGHLWLGTNKGLCRFNTATYKIRTFSKRHGLPCYEFNRYHNLYFPNGQMACGGINSGVLFDPLDITEDNLDLNTVITEIKINSMAGKFSLPVNTIKNLNLSYDQNTLAIEYAALEYGQPQDILYRYRLKGYDDKWVKAGNKREAVYTKIPPGEYVFEVNSTDIAGNWSNKFKQINIKISPPWWATWWAYSIYILVLAGAISFIIKYRVKQVFIKNEIYLRQKESEQLKELDAAKSRFFSNITHELRTPLTLIAGPVEQLRAVSDPEQQQNLLDIISNNANSLLNLTNQLLEIAKLEAGALQPCPMWGDIAGAITQHCRLFSEAAALNKNTIEFIGPANAEYLFEPEMLERIIFNLLSNALKNSYAGDKITVTLSEVYEGVQICVQDTGCGIPQKELTNIFKRFRQVNADKKEKGTGIGLSLVKELIEVQRGTIEIVSSDEKHDHGTTLIVNLPYLKGVCIHEDNGANTDIHLNAAHEAVADKPLVSPGRR
jgi:signal transduction histidine kinase/ligand-binding sensor domain-containing protein